MEKRYLYKLLFVFATLCLFSCNGYLEEVPQNKQKLSSTDDYEQLLNNAYLTKFVLPYIDLLTDDVSYIAKLRDPGMANLADSYLGAYMWDNSIESTMLSGDETFALFYKSIFNTNVVIENIDEAEGSSANENEVKSARANIKGEAYVLRAFRYLYLVNMYAPHYDPATCATTPGIPVNLNIVAEDKAYTRAKLAEVYEQIVGDLKAGIRLLEEYPMLKVKSRFSAIAAKALLARVYLYMQEWDLAIEQAAAVVQENPTLFDLRPKGEDKRIYTERRLSSWVTEDEIPGEGYLAMENTNVLFVNGVNELFEIFDRNAAVSVFKINRELYDAYPKDDIRRYYFMRINQEGVVEYFKNRYFETIFTPDWSEVQLSTDYGFVRAIRTEEMYLILAEAYAHKPDGMATAVGYLNTLREAKFKKGSFEKYGKLDAGDYTQTTLLEKVWMERRLELCFEEHRWFDLRRTTRPSITHVGLNNQTSTLKQDDPRYVLQIPHKELSANPEIGPNPR